MVRNAARHFRLYVTSQGFTLTRYILGHYFKSFFLVLPALVGILLVFDSLANADSVLEHQDTIFKPLLAYLGLRLPAILTLILPISGLLAAMMTFSKLTMSSEMIAMRSVTGFSAYRVVRILYIAAGFIAASHFLFANLVLPGAASRLSAWENNDYRGMPIKPRENDQFQNWFISGNLFLKIDRATRDGTKLRGLDLVQRDKNGLVEKIYSADTARYYEDKGWVFDDLTPSGSDQSLLMLDAVPEDFKVSAKSEEEMSYGELTRLLESETLETGLESRHQTWLHYKLAHPLSIFIMILIAAPMSLQIARRGNLMRSGFLIILGGFGYFIFERVMLSLGETGALPAILAGWSPLAIAWLVCFWVLLMLEG